MLLKFEELFPQVEATAAGLSKINSVTPPSDTRAIVRYANSLLQPLSGVDIKILSEVDSTPNLVARVKGRRPGKLAASAFRRRGDWAASLWRRRFRHESRMRLVVVHFHFHGAAS